MGTFFNKKWVFVFTLNKNTHCGSSLHLAACAMRVEKDNGKATVSYKSKLFPVSFTRRRSGLAGRVSSKVTNGGTTPIKNGRRFLTPLVYAGCLLTGLEAAFAKAERSRTPSDLPEQAASNL